MTKAKLPPKYVGSNTPVRVCIGKTGSVGVELTDTPGTWLWTSGPVDSMLAHVRRELGVGNLEILKAINVASSSVSRARSGHYDIQIEWLVKLSDLSGIPFDELRWVAGLGHMAEPHERARIRNGHGTWSSNTNAV